VNNGGSSFRRVIAAHYALLPRRTADSDVTTINSYPKLFDREADRRMLAILRQSYRNVYLWIQTHSDFEYARALDPNLAFVNPSLDALDAVLASDLDIDCIGSRRTLASVPEARKARHHRRDRQPREMGRDFGFRRGANGFSRARA
jgi:hypothetical protein